MIDSILRSDIAGNEILFAASDGDPIDFLGTYSEKYLSLELETENVAFERKPLKNGFELRFTGQIPHKISDPVFSEVKVSVVAEKNGQIVISYTADFDLSLRLKVFRGVRTEYIGASETGASESTCLKLTKGERSIYIASESGNELDAEGQRIVLRPGEGRLFVRPNEATYDVPATYGAVTLKKSLPLRDVALNTLEKLSVLQSREGGFFLGNEIEKVTDVLKVIDLLFSAGSCRSARRCIDFFLSLCEKYRDIPTHCDAVGGKIILSKGKYNPARDELLLLIFKHIGEFSACDLKRIRPMILLLSDKNSAKTKNGLLPFCGDEAVVNNGGVDIEKDDNLSFVSTVKHIGVLRGISRLADSGKISLSPSKKRSITDFCAYMTRQVRERFTRGLSVYHNSALSNQKCVFEEALVFERCVGAELFPFVLTKIDVEKFDITGLAMSLKYYEDEKEHLLKILRILADKISQDSEKIELPELCFALGQAIKYCSKEGKL